MTSDQSPPPHFFDQFALVPTGFSVASAGRKEDHKRHAYLVATATWPVSAVLAVRSLPHLDRTSYPPRCHRLASWPASALFCPEKCGVFRRGRLIDCRALTTSLNLTLATHPPGRPPLEPPASRCQIRLQPDPITLGQPAVPLDQYACRFQKPQPLFGLRILSHHHHLLRVCR